MSRVIIFSTVFPSYHPRKGQPTFFEEKFWNFFRDENGMMPIGFIDCFLDTHICLSSSGIITDVKHHTIRAGNRWKAGDLFSPRIWSGKPYRSKMIKIGPLIEIRNTWPFEIDQDGCFFINGELYAYSSSIDAINKLAQNDGLDIGDFNTWFNKPFKGQIISWNPTELY